MDWVESVTIFSTTSFKTLTHTDHFFLNSKLPRTGGGPDFLEHNGPCSSQRGQNHGRGSVGFVVNDPVHIWQVCLVM